MSTTKPESETGWTDDATPRPWRAYKGSPGDSHWFVARDTGPVSAYGAAVTGWGRVQQTEADAKLITAAVNSYSPSDFEQLVRLQDWKESAMTLLARYDSIAETFGGKLGSSKLDNLERGVERLRKVASDAAQWIESQAWPCQHSDQPMRCTRCATRAKAKELVAALRESLAPVNNLHDGEEMNG